MAIYSSTLRLPHSVYLNEPMLFQYACQDNIFERKNKIMLSFFVKSKLSVQIDFVIDDHEKELVVFVQRSAD